MLVYWICYSPLQFGTVELELGLLQTNLGAFLSNTVAFITASVFSYFANVFLTFKPVQKSAKQFSFVMGVFVVRMLVSNLLTTAFDFIVLNGFHADYTLNPWMTIIAPFFASALLIPIAYFALEYVFKKTDIQKK